MPAESVEEVIKSTQTVEDDEGMIKYDGIFYKNIYLSFQKLSFDYNIYI